MLTPVADFGPNPGALDMYEYAPAELPAGRPLVVIMHGCTQTAMAMEAQGWETLANQHQFAIVYAQQRSANQQLSCFSWFNDGDITRGQGEAESIIEMVDKEIATHGSDRSRVYVTGFSAGGAMTAVMLATYPDRFRAGTVMSGLPYRCPLTNNLVCPSKTPDEWGELVRAADPGFTGTRPRVQIWQGSSDYTVSPSDATELVKQWTNVWGIDQTATATDTLGPATRTRYTSAVELYLVMGMGHAISIGNDDMGMCPASLGAFYADDKLCAPLHAAEFFGLLGDHDPGGDGAGSGSGSGSAGSDDDVNGGCAATDPAGLGVLGIVVVALARRRRRPM